MKHFDYNDFVNKKRCGDINFSGLDLTAIRLDADIRLDDCICNNYKFRGSDMRGSIFNHTRFDKCDFSGADLRGSSFYEVKLSECNFSGADLRGTHFYKCDIDNATRFKGTTVSGIYFDDMEIPLEIRPIVYMNIK